MPVEHRFDVLVVGAGPAGLAAASAAVGARKRVGVVDENPAPGGQIWRGERRERAPDPPKNRGITLGWLLSELEVCNLTFLPATRVVAQQAPQTLLAEGPEGPVLLGYDHLILAPGARELFLPFPGWTLPNVLGAGGLQALVKSGLEISGKRVVVVGSGPLLLAVASYLQKRGAVLGVIAEQAPMGRILRFTVSLLGSWDKLEQALALRRSLREVRYRTGTWPLAASGKTRVESVTLTNGRRTWEEPCEYLACGFGLVPNTELPRLLGCAMASGFVAVDDKQRTSVEGVFCAGEATGIGGLSKSLAEGFIAGEAAGGRGQTSPLFLPDGAEPERRFVKVLERTFALREELKRLPQPDTIVCRCEDVTLAQLASYEPGRPAKLQTRCGMGPCQGRICGPALEYLRGPAGDTIRPPLFPVRLGSLVQGPDSYRGE
jgi:NADPH-dependent 2,4-dienoyl-CoA reductase/sulfur reductase-like enzyme